MKHVATLLLSLTLIHPGLSGAGTLTTMKRENTCMCARARSRQSWNNCHLQQAWLILPTKPTSSRKSSRSRLEELRHHIAALRGGSSSDFHPYDPATYSSCESILPTERLLELRTMFSCLPTVAAMMLRSHGGKLVCMRDTNSGARWGGGHDDAWAGA
jgi:hypothetical protein